MEIYEGVDQFPSLKYPVVTSGTFDGVHLGHQKILSRLREIANNHDGETVLLTFWPHPRIILKPENHGIELLTSFDEKAALLAKNGIDHLVRIKFTPEFSRLTSTEFVQHFLVDNIKTRKLVIGYDHRFGKSREGSFDYLSKNKHRFGFEVEEIPEQDIDHNAISSTIIREALRAGEIEKASQYLGRFYDLSGTVIEGDQIGRKLGFPTANIAIKEKLKLIPGDGAYAVNVDVDGSSYQGMMNIGYRPTVDGQKKTIEVHLFDFDKNIYQQEVRVIFVKQIRKEVKFADKEALTTQLHLDKKAALEILNAKN